MGPQEDYIETVVTCEGDFHDPQLQDRLQRFQRRLESLLLEDGKNQLVLKKVEPWNSVRVTFNIPREAALRLRQLAEQGNASLRQMGVLGVQIEGDRLVSLTVATPNNQRAELIIQTHNGSGQAAAAASGAPQVAPVGASVSLDPGLPSSSDEPGSPGPSMEVTRKNIEEYLRQGSLFSSLLAPSPGAGPSGAGPSSDIFKAPSAEGGPYRANNIASDAMPGPSGLSGFPPRTAFSSLGGHGHGAFTPPGVSGQMTGHRGPRTSGPHPNVQHAPQAQLPQQQMPSQGTALPQTAALGYNVMSLPPPPPYPHGHGAGVANNVGRQGKKTTASSPLLINLLQTDPMAAANNVMGSDKPKKKRRRKNKQVSATATSEGLVNAQDMHSLPSDSHPASNIIPPQTMPSAEEMSAVLHRQVSPVPLPSPRLSAGFGPSLPSGSEHGVGNEGLRDRKPSTASAALVNLAHSRSIEGEPFNADSIINPYTGLLEPRDSASDLSPRKKTQHKARSHSLTESSASALPHPPPPVSAARVDARTGSSDSLHIGLGSYHQGAAVPSALREDSVVRGFTFPPSVPQPVQTHSAASDSVLAQRPEMANPHVATTTSASPLGAAPNIYAQHPFGPSQPLSRTSHTVPALQHSSPFPVATANGPVPVTMPPSTHTVSTSRQVFEGQDSRSQVPGPESGGSNPYHMPPHSHRSPASVRAEVVHNVPVSSEARGGGQGTLDTSGHQTRTVASSQPVTHKAAPVADVRHGAPPPTTISAHVQSDSLKLLNSSSSSSSSPAAGGVQRVAAETAATTTSTASPTGSKPPSDGDDNSNHSNVSPGGQADPTTAPSSLLDANGTKVDNHDSGVGSSSERSEDTTPSEAGDGEFQASVATVEVSATDSSGSKVSVGVSKAVVNCKKEASGSGGDPHTITVGYVQMNQHTPDLYKDSKKLIVDSTPLIGDKASAEDPLRQVTNLIKSTTGLAPVAGQMALAAHKEVEMSLSMSAKIPSVQQQQFMKYKATQVPGVHQNGPQSLPHGVRHQQPSGLRLSNHTQAAVRHPTGITISHSQGHLGVHHQPTVPPSSQAMHRVPLNQGQHHPPGSVATSQPPQHLPASVATSRPLQHPPGSVASSQPLHHLPGSIATSQALQHQQESVVTSQPLQHLPANVASCQAFHQPPGSVAYSQALHHPSGNVTTSQHLQHLSASIATSQALHHPGNGGVVRDLHHPSVSVASSLATHHAPKSVAGSEGMQYTPVSVRDSQVSQHLPVSVTAGSQTVQHPAWSVANSQSHHPPSSMPSNAGQGQFHHGTPTCFSVAPHHGGVSGHGVTSVSHAAVHGAGVTSFPAVSMTLIDSHGQRTMGPRPGNHGIHPAGGLVAHSNAVISHNQGHGPAVSTATAMHHMGLSPHPHLQTRTLSPHQHPHVTPTNGPSIPNAVGNRQGGDKVPRTVPSPLVSAAPTIPDITSVARSPASAHNDRGSVGQPISNARKTAVENSVPSSVGTEGTGKGHITGTTVSSVLETAEGGLTSHPPKQGSPRLAPSNPSSVTINLNKSIGHDLSSLASDVVNSGAVNDLDLLEATYPHNDDVMFDDDLTLVSEPGLSALLEAGMRHGTANGSGGLTTEARGVSNITSMYNKRSSPINVNMLNHMYAAGLPQPRRLTESVQRLVKPLPNPENSLPPGRACKSPGASSRHSSNGSTSPGRASQGGARSPGANVSSAPSSRNLSFDKLLSNTSSAVNSVGGGSGYPPVYHTAQPAVSATMVNCVNTSVIPAAPHPLASLQSTAGVRGKGGNGPVSLSTSPGSQQNCMMASSSGGSAVFTSVSSASASFSSSPSSSSAVPTLLTVTPQPVPDTANSSHQEALTFPHDALQSQMQLPALNHSTISSSFPSSLPHTTAPHPPSLHHPPLPALVHLNSTQSSSCVNRMSGAAVSATVSLPSVVTAVSAAYSHVPTSVRLSHPPLPPQRPGVSVCNTSTRVHSVPSSGLPLSSSSRVLPVSTSVSIPSPVPSPTVTQQHSLVSMPASTSSVPRATSVSSTFDLCKHVPVDSTSQTASTSATSSLHVANESTVAAVSHPIVAPTPVTVAYEHQQTVPPPVCSSTVQSDTKVENSVEPSTVTCERNVKDGTEARTDGSKQLAPHPHTQPSVATERSTSVTGSSGVDPASQTVVSQGAQSETVESSGSGDDLSRNLPAQIQPTGCSVPKAEGGAPGWSRPPVLKESVGKEKEEGEGGSKSAASSMPPLSHHNAQDSSIHSDIVHSKPPLLQPTPPLTLSTPMSSATPPPPPLTPVLLQAPNPGHSTPPLSSSSEGQMEMTASFHLREVPRTASPLSQASEPAAAAAEFIEQKSSDAENRSADEKSETGSCQNTASVQPTSEGDQPTTGDEPTSADSSLDESSLTTRRFTRKRKSTYSESDLSSELAPKLSCVDDAVGNGSRGTESKTSSGSDQPPKLQREVNKKDEKKGGKRDEKSAKKEEESIEKEDEIKGGPKEEEKEEKKEDEKGGKEEDESGGEKDEMGLKKEEDKGGSKNAMHDKNIVEATPEEIAKKMAAATTGGKRRVHYAYVPEKSLNQSYFETPVLTGRTRSQGTRGSREGSSGGREGAASSSQPSAGQVAPSATPIKEDGGETTATAGSKRSTRSLRTKDSGDSGQSKRKRVKEHR
ncbi:streptococcal hemagglutinin-like [Littorina saxatilis]|uniref:Nuclear receptor coactivator 6 TRADD-N domain-containing protein n=1 Tax=Littorina saxatilis TaxID=31220 RepID=A0AAN9BAW5_9CAEN